jgi:hypothetical protein
VRVDLLGVFTEVVRVDAFGNFVVVMDHLSGLLGKRSSDDRRGGTLPAVFVDGRSGRREFARQRRDIAFICAASRAMVSTRHASEPAGACASGRAGVLREQRESVTIEAGTANRNEPSSRSGGFNRSSFGSTLRLSSEAHRRFQQQP